MATYRPRYMSTLPPRFQPGDSVAIDAPLPYPCPNCSGTFTASGEDMVVIHSLPTCAAYDAIETVDDALSFLRRATAKQLILGLADGFKIKE